MRTALLALCILFFLPSVEANDTIRVYFPTGVSVLTPSAQRTIDSFVYNEVLVAGKQVGIIGYADYVGNERSNISLSEARAKSVQAYLEGMGFGKEEIQLVAGKGEINRDMADNTGYPEDRRVDIIPGGFKTKAPVPPAKTMDLTKVKLNESVRLDNINFQPGSDQFLPEAIPTLEALLKTMQQHPKMAIQIEGHICCMPKNATRKNDPDDWFFSLSVMRAKAVYKYLADHGIEKTRLKYLGFGFNGPLVFPEKTEEDMIKNRRVEIRILAK